MHQPVPTHHPSVRPLQSRNASSSESSSPSGATTRAGMGDLSARSGSFLVGLNSKWYHRPPGALPPSGYHIASTIRSCGQNAPRAHTAAPSSSSASLPHSLPASQLHGSPLPAYKDPAGQCQAAAWGSHLLPELRPTYRVHSTAPCPTVIQQLHWTGKLGGGQCCGLAMQPGLLSVLFSFHVYAPRIAQDTRYLLRHSSLSQVLKAYLVCL